MPVAYNPGYAQPHEWEFFYCYISTATVYSPYISQTIDAKTESGYKLSRECVSQATSYEDHLSS